MLKVTLLVPFVVMRTKTVHVLWLVYQILQHLLPHKTILVLVLVLLKTILVLILPATAKT